jgi:hypothetical protein
MVRRMRAALFSLAAFAVGCAGQTDHATHSAELADDWIKEASNTNETAMTVKFSTDLSFKLVARDGTQFAGTFEVVDPLVLMTPTIPPNTLWCIPRASFSGAGLSTVTFATFDPTICGNTKSGPGIMSPLEGAYDVDTAAESM